MSAMASAGVTRNKLFKMSAESSSVAARYFEGINTLVEEMRYDYPDACRAIGLAAKSDNMKSFLLRFSDALRSGEPIADYLAREASVQGEDYENHYERDLEGLKQWSNAFSSIVISVALIVIIQIVSAMISSLNPPMMLGLITSGVGMAGFGAYIIRQSAPKETMTITPTEGSPEQLRAYNLMRSLLPFAFMVALVLYILGAHLGTIFIVLSIFMVPIGFISMQSDGKTSKKDTEFAAFLRSSGGMASSSGTTIQVALTKMDLSSFPTLEPDIVRLSKRLHARVEPEQCWSKFGLETGSRLISDVTDIFYTGIQIGGDPERVGYLCSLFTAKTTQLRARRRMNASTFAGLTIVMHIVLAGLMVFILSIVTNFAKLVSELMPSGDAAAEGQRTMSMGMANFSASDLQFLSIITVVMIVMMALVGSFAVMLTDGGYKLKIFFYIAMTTFISGVSLLVVPPMVAGILKV
jgi:flagellar protein FlaJ